MLDFLLALKLNLTPVKVQTQKVVPIEEIQIKAPALVARRVRGWMNRNGQNVAAHYCKNYQGNRLTSGPDGNGIIQCGDKANGGVRGGFGGKDFTVGGDFYINNEGSNSNNYNMQDACSSVYPAGYFFTLRNGHTIQLNQASDYRNGGCYADDVEYN